MTHEKTTNKTFFTAWNRERLILKKNNKLNVSIYIKIFKEMTKNNVYKKNNVFKPVVSYVQIVKLITALVNFSMITLESVKRDVNETE